MVAAVLAWIITVICNILVLLLLARTVLSWVMLSNYRRNSGIANAYKILFKLTETIVRPVRTFISRFVNFGPLDVAPLVTFFIILFISRILTRLLLAI